MSRFTKEQRKSYRTIFWGLVLILAAVLLILDGAGLPLGGGLRPWRIILGVLLLAWLVWEIIRLKFTEIFFPIAFLFIVFQSPLAQAVGHGSDEFLSPWVVILAAVLLTIGFQFLFKKKDVRISVEPDEDKTEKRIGEETIYFDASDLSNVEIRDHIGTVNVCISNLEAYTGGGKITVRENLGEVKLHIPNEWDLAVSAKSNLGKVTVPDHTAPGGKTLSVEITKNLGEISVIFV